MSNRFLEPLPYWRATKAAMIRWYLSHNGKHAAIRISGASGSIFIEEKELDEFLEALQSIASERPNASSD